ncbi:MAG: hypothetical protein RLZ12_640 [Bacillota bacterium]|jgi:hypothetical protein
MMDRDVFRCKKPVLYLVTDYRDYTLHKFYEHLTTLIKSGLVVIVFVLNQAPESQNQAVL